MAIYLVQHGNAVPEERDPERGLSPEGVADCERIAGVAAGYHVKVAAIEHSGKKRARQTAEIFAARLAPAGGVKEAAGLAPKDDPAPVAARLDPASNLMLVGHLPFLERLAALLVTGQAGRPVFRFQQGGLVCLDLHPDTRTWVVKWALMPKVG